MKPRNPIAKALRSPTLHQRRLPSKPKPQPEYSEWSLESTLDAFEVSDFEEQSQ